MRWSRIRIALAAVLSAAPLALACESFGTGPSSAPADGGASLDDAQPSGDADVPDASGPVDPLTLPRTAGRYRDAVLAAGPSDYWPLDDSSGSLTAVNHRRDGGDARLESGRPAFFGQPGLFGEKTALVFDGGSDTYLEADVPYPADGGRAVTVEAWFRTGEPLDAAKRYLFYQYELNGSADNAFGVHVSATAFVGEIFDGNYRTFLRGLTELKTTWHHVVFTSAPSLWIDGDLFSTKERDDADPKGNGGPFRIGGSEDDPALRGAICEVAIYPYVLAEPQIRLHYALGRPR